MSYDTLEPMLREALSHLYDERYRPPVALCEFLGCGARPDLPAVQSAILHAIAELQPPPESAAGSPVERIYELLRNRYVLKLTLEETATRMNTSVSGVSRLQRSAVHALGRVLWERRWVESGLPAPARAAGDADARPQNDGSARADWHSQTLRELASLRSSAPDAVTDVAEAIRSAVELMDPLLARPGVRLEISYLQPGMVTTIHRSALRQLLITTLGRLARCSAPGNVLGLYAGLEDGVVRVALTGAAGTVDGLLAADILVPEDVVVEAGVEGGRLSLTLELPTVGTVTVLAIDDNPDMARLYRRYSEGTQYHIVHFGQGRGLFEALRATAPDIILLDVMLPDMDGWELLMQLRADPRTRAIPVIVSSVVREQELALALGAAGYLSKPVRPAEFTRALDQARAQVSAARQRAPETRPAGD